MTYDERMALRLNEEPDNQMLLDFAQPEGDNLGVKDEWHEAYEAGFVAGKSSGKKEFMQQYLEERQRLAKEIESNEIIPEHGTNDTGPRDPEAESNRD